VGLSGELGKTVRAALKCWRRTARLCILLLFAGAAGAVFVYLFLNVLPMYFSSGAAA